MEKVYDNIVDGVIINSIVADADFVANLEGIWELRTKLNVVEPTEEQTSRDWRNLELKSTDWIVPITDHPQRDSYLAYRASLRDWPSMDSFPDTKPTL